MSGLRSSVSKELSLGALACGAFFLIACGVSSSIGADEPFRVQEGQFYEGELPVSDESTPTVTSPVVSTVLRERVRGVNFSGLTSDNASAIGVKFDGFGSGYWLVPTGARDAQNQKSFTYSFTADLQESLPAGRHTLQLVGFDGDGAPGPISESSVCVQSLRPDNGNACFPQIAPPALVLSLEWDAPVDLDISVVFPSGEVVNALRPGIPNPADPAAPPLARLVTDGNTDCHLDSRQREDVVFEQLPPPGKYAIYASLYRDCGSSSVRYSASYASRTRDGEEYGVRTSQVGGGILTRAQFQRGNQLGTFIDEVQVQ